MSLNDPEWGRGNKQNGPPDLDELWRDFNRKLAAMFGKKSGGNRGGDDRPPVNMRQFGGGIGLIVVLIVLLWLASGFYIVDAAQRAVVLQFGKYIETTEPGLRWRLPYPIQTYELVEVTKVRTVEIGYRGSEKNKMLKEALMLTDDENIVSVQFAVQYLLKSPTDYQFKNRSPEEAVTAAAETAIREVVGKSKMDFVLYEGRDQIAAQTSKLIQDILDRYEMGIQIRSVTMQSTQPPEQVQAAFDDAVKASQDRERHKNEGQAYANDVIPKARGTAARLLEEANGYKGRVIANAEGEASRFKQVVAEYAKAPEVMRTRLYYEAWQQMLSNTSKVLVDTKGNGNLLYLPLDKLMQVAGAGQNQAPTPVQPQNQDSSAARTQPQGQTNAPAANMTDVAPQVEKQDSSTYRSRDALRSRERSDR